MKTSLHASQITTLLATTIFAGFFATQTIAATNDIEHVTVINNSDIAVVPTAEGFMNGCVGGSLPPLSQPISPHTTRKIDVVVVKYAKTCRFNLLPLPNMVTYPKACHSIQDNATVTFTGQDISTMYCTVN